MTTIFTGHDTLFLVHSAVGIIVFYISDTDCGIALTGINDAV